MNKAFVDSKVSVMDRHVAALMEHFDSVQILCSVRIPDGSGTQGFARGGGDWYARQGLAHEFINREEATEVAQAISETEETQ